MLYTTGDAVEFCIGAQQDTSYYNIVRILLQHHVQYTKVNTI